MSMDELISVIVPVYNAERYIRRAIDSILSQTYRNIEVVLVDDGSTDESGSICEAYSFEDGRIKVIRQSNMGVVIAKQNGIKVASGDYIAWVDADDWIEHDYIEKLVQLECESGADIVAVAHYHNIGEDNTIVKNGIPCGVYSGKDIVARMLCTDNFFEYGITPQLVTKLVRANILKKNQMKVDAEIIAGDDAAVVYPSLLDADRICVSDICGYHYIQHENSVTKHRYSDERARIVRLIQYLDAEFRTRGVGEMMDRQLAWYQEYLMILRDIEGLDAGIEKGFILSAYGGLNYGSRVVIYGAGVLGQEIYSYIRRSKKLELVGWVDKNWELYRDRGMDVSAPGSIIGQKEEYDYIIVANITYATAQSIRKYLLSQGIESNNIKLLKYM